MDDDHHEPTAARRMLGRASDIAGGSDALARFLHLSPEDMRAWRAGDKPVPFKVFLALIDVVTANRLVWDAATNLARRRDPSWSGADRRRHDDST